jgi:hypothetical protein
MTYEIRKRLEKCCFEHEQCPNSGDGKLPSRLIDVGETGEDQVRLHITDPEELGRYFALSYIWGGRQEVITTIRTLVDRKVGIPMSALPSTIRDAVNLIRDLGVCRYLWVDALCIIQDDHHDKIYEINRMGTIYKNAVLTIAAANTNSAHDSFLADRTVPSTCTLPYLLPDGTVGKLWLCHGYPELILSPLDSRGWGLQESLLSPRLLWYGPADVKWKCTTTPFDNVYKTHTHDSMYPSDSHRRLPASIFASASDYETDITEQQNEVWKVVVGDFSNRDVTFQEDRLPALTGVVTELQKVWRDDYFAGMWRRCLIRHLGWGNEAENVTPGPDTDFLNLHLPPEGTYRSPGWSWASFPGHVGIWETAKAHAEVVSCQVTLVDQTAPLSRVQSGTLVLLAALITEDQRLEINGDDCWFKWDYRHCYHQDHINRTLSYVFLGYKEDGKGVALVLAPVGDGTFMRIGVVFGFKTGHWTPEMFEKRVVTII